MHQAGDQQDAGGDLHRGIAAIAGRQASVLEQEIAHEADRDAEEADEIEGGHSLFKENGAPDRTLTCNLRSRNPTLYTVELREQWIVGGYYRLNLSKLLLPLFTVVSFWCVRLDSNQHIPRLHPKIGPRRVRPLRHPRMPYIYLRPALLSIPFEFPECLFAILGDQNDPRIGEYSFCVRVVHQFGPSRVLCRCYEMIPMVGYIEALIGYRDAEEVLDVGMGREIGVEDENISFDKGTARDALTEALDMEEDQIG